MAVVNPVKDAFTAVLSSTRKSLKQGARHAITVIETKEGFELRLVQEGGEAKAERCTVAKRHIAALCLSLENEAGESNLPILKLVKLEDGTYRCAWRLVTENLTPRLVSGAMIEARFNPC